jgi:hypothetical protein
MKRRIVALLTCAVLPATLRAIPFEEARVTETVNIVSLLRQLQAPQPATTGDVIKGETGLKTGGDSRAELKFPDLTLTRVGSNSLFRFYPGGRDMTLDGGTMLFYSPGGAGGGKVQAGAVTAAVTGSAISVLNLTSVFKTPYVRVVCLEHAAVVSGPGFTRKIRAGQVIDQDGKVTNIDLREVAKGNLFTGFSTSLPFVIRDYQKVPINLDTTVDSAGQIARRTILGDQQQLPANVGGQIPATTTTSRTTFPPGVRSTSSPASISPAPTPAPTPRHRLHRLRKLLKKIIRHHRPPRPPQEVPGEGGQEGGGPLRRGR